MKEQNIIDTELLFLIKKAAKKEILFLHHAVTQMSRMDRMITSGEIRKIINEGEIIEDYREDRRGRSCLLSGKGNNNRVIHVVCSPKEEYLAIITAYLPNPNEWKNNFKVRVKKELNNEKMSPLSRKNGKRTSPISY